MADHEERGREARERALLEQICPCRGNEHDPEMRLECAWALTLVREVFASDWLMAHDAEVAAAAWDEAVKEARGMGKVENESWFFDALAARNPYRVDEGNPR